MRSSAFRSAVESIVAAYFRGGKAEADYTYRQHCAAARLTRAEAVALNDGVVAEIRTQLKAREIPDVPPKGE
jgi:hypothetical protein